MTLRRRLKDIFLILFISIYILIYFSIIVPKVPNYAITINGLFVCLVAFLSYMLYGFQQYDLNDIRKKVIKEVIISIFIYFTVIYFLGLFTGFLRNAYSLEFISILNNVFIPLLSIIALELFRYIFISANKDSIPWVFVGTIGITLLDIVLNYVHIGSSTIEIFVYLSVVILPLIFKNFVMSYLSYHVGYHVTLIYVIPLSIYKYLVPVFPDLGNYLMCITGITLPSMVFIYSSRMMSEYYQGQQKKFKAIKAILIDVPLIVLFTIFIGLVSGYFNYHLIGVNTSQIEPIVNRGDAAMIYRYVELKDLNVGDIIAYQGYDDIIIDKVADKKTDEDGVKIYIKTTIVEGGEDKYKLITEDELVGLYKFRIEKVAYPTIWFKEYIRGGTSEE